MKHTDMDDGSMGGSRRSSARARSKSSISDKMFQVLVQFDSPAKDTPFESAVNRTLVAIDALQQAGLIINPHFGYNLPVVKQLCFFVFSSHLPIWDPVYAELEFLKFLVYYGLVAAVVVLMVFYLAATGGGVFDISEYRLLKKNAVVWFHLVSGVLFIPFFQVLAASMFCHDKHLWAFPEEQCWGVKSTILFSLSLLLMAMLASLALLGSFTLFDDDMTKRSLLIQAHSRVETQVLVTKILSVLAMHLMLGSGHVKGYACAIFILNFLNLVGYTVCLPYYRLEMNQFKCGIAGMNCFCALLVFVAVLQSGDSAVLFDKDLVALMVFCIVPFGFIFGYHIGASRVSNECLERIHHLKSNGEVFAHECHFPAGLILKEGILQKGEVSLETEVLESQESGLDIFLIQKMQKTEILVPYINFVFLSTDAEVATRFLMAHTDVYAQKDLDSVSCGVSAYMVAFAARIFLKKKFTYNTPNITTLHFANFIRVFCTASKLVHALEQCESLAHVDADFSTRYQAFRVITVLRDQLGINNVIHKFALTKAKMLHKEILSDMSTFWLKVMDSKHDVLNLASLTNQITCKRNESHSAYRKAVQEAGMDREVLTSFASFLEFVMLEKRQADFIQGKLSEMGEEMRRSMMGGDRTPSHTGTGATNAANANILSILDPDDGKDKENTFEANTSAKLMSKSTKVVFLFIVLSSLGILACSTTSWFLQVQSFESVYDMGQARTRLQLASLKALYVKDALFNPQSPQPSIVERQNALQVSIEQYELAHSKLMSSESSHSQTKGKFKEHRYILDDGFGNEGSPVSLWELGLEVKSSLTFIAVANLNNSDEAVVLFSPFFKYFDFIERNVETELNRVYNDTIPYYLDADEVVRSWVIGGLVCGMFITTVLLVIAAVIFSLNFRKIGVNKIVAIQLFSFIPFLTQKQLYHTSREKVKEFARAARDIEKEAEVEATSDGENSEIDKSHTQDDNTPKQQRLSLSVSKLKGSATFHHSGHGQRPGALTSILKKRESRKRPSTKKTKEKKKVRFEFPEGDGPSPVTSKKKIVEKVPEIFCKNPESIGMTEEDKIELLEADFKNQQSITQDKKNAYKDERVLYSTLSVLVGLFQLPCFFLCLALHYSVDSFVESESSLRRFHEISVDLGREILVQRELSFAGVLGVDMHTHILPYFNRRNSQGFYQKKKALLKELRGADELNVQWAIEKQMKAIEGTEDIAMALTQRSYGLSSTVFSTHLSSLSWKKQYHGGLPYLRSYDYGYTTTAEDTAKPEGMGALAKKVISSQRLSYEVSQLVNTFGEATNNRYTKRRDDAESARTEASQILFVTIGCAAAGTVLSIVAFIANWVFERDSFQNGERVSYVLSVLANLTLVCILIAVDVRKEDIRDPDTHGILSLSNATQHSLAVQSMLLGAFIAEGDPMSYVDYWQEVDKNVFQNCFLTPRAELQQDGFLLTSLNEWYAEYTLRKNIAIEMMTWNRTYQNIFTRKEHAITWNGAPLGSPRVWYNTTEHDKTLSLEERREIATQLLVGEDTHALLEQIHASTDQIVAEAFDSRSRDLQTTEDTVQRLIYVCIGLAGVTCLCYLIITTCVFLKYMKILSKGISTVVEHVSHVLFSTLILKSRIAFLLILILVGTQTVFGLRGAIISKEKIEQLELSSRREWVIVRSAISAEFFVNAKNSGKLSNQHRVSLSSLITEIEQTRNSLYHASNLLPIVSGDNIDRLYIKWIDLLQELTSYQSPQAGSSNSTQTGTANDVASRSIERIKLDLRILFDEIVTKLWLDGEGLKADGETVCNFFFLSENLALWPIILGYHEKIEY